MTRPYYESDADRTKEQDVVDLFCQVFSRGGRKFSSAKLKPSLIVDYAIVDAATPNKEVVSVVEVKVRNRSYPELFIGLSKVQKMREYVCDGLLARILFATPEGVYLQKVEFPDGDMSIRGAIGMAGRTDRGDKQDIEPVVYWPMSGMQRIADSRPEWFK